VHHCCTASSISPSISNYRASRSLDTSLVGIQTDSPAQPVIIALVRSSYVCDDDWVAGIELHGEIVEWMASLDTTEWDRTVIVIDRLADLGSMARMPFSKALGDGLFELRFTLGSTSRRITYRFTRDNQIILLTTFRKQRNNERSEITRARQIADECARLNP
jgi:putative component of toxin-antitoxin plasmid stabilization module